jgi:glycosyltransferase involved in cell wall biosynthesis
LIERFCFKSGKYFISINPYAKGFILRSSFGKIFEVKNPVHEIYFKCPDRTKNGRVLFVALLTPIKGIIELLQVTRLVRDSYSNVKLHIVGLFGSGLGWYEREVHNFINQYNLKENVEFLGFMDEEGVMEELSLSNCLLMTSKSETAPTVISEAMAAGKPVVAMDVGGIRYMVQNRITGYLISPDDFRGMADKIIRILKDESLRTKMGNSARLVALERFHPDIVATRTLETYKDILTFTK